MNTREAAAFVQAVAQWDGLYLLVGANGVGKTKILRHLWKRLVAGKYYRNRNFPLDPGKKLNYWVHGDFTPWVYTHAKRAMPHLPVVLEAKDWGQRGVLSCLLTAEHAVSDSWVLIDGAFDSLHPHAIRALYDALKEKADEKGLKVVISTQSTVLLSEMGREEGGYERIVVYHEGEFKRLLDIHPEEYLVHFALGDLYDREKFGMPLAGDTEEE